VATWGGFGQSWARETLPTRGASTTADTKTAVRTAEVCQLSFERSLFMRASLMPVRAYKFTYEEIFYCFYRCLSIQKTNIPLKYEEYYFLFLFLDSLILIYATFPGFPRVRNLEKWSMQSRVRVHGPEFRD
jgi:hypothetical protein